ncbi:MAG: hypothetical protein WC511_02290 [Candidatus Pacearchaeota archaeon]
MNTFYKIWTMCCFIALLLTISFSIQTTQDSYKDLQIIKTELKEIRAENALQSVKIAELVKRFNDTQIIYAKELKVSPGSRTFTGEP